MIKTIEEAESLVENLRSFYLKYIEEAVTKAGSMRQLSAALGREEKGVQKILERNSFSAIRRLAGEIKELKR
jgi:hypothetical protein